MKKLIITAFLLITNILLVGTLSANNSAWDYARSGGWGVLYPSEQQAAITCIAEFIKIKHGTSEKVTLSCLGKPLTPHAQNIDVVFSYDMPCLTPEGRYGPPGTCNWPNFFGGTIYISQKTQKLVFKASAP